MTNGPTNYRYPGVQPFRTDQQHLFFGRNSDIEALFELVFTEKVTVLYGKSGYGKSSLLNAGILPRLTNERNRRRYRFLPIAVRFFNWSGQPEETPLQKFIATLAEALPPHKDADFLEHSSLQRNLWWLAMRRMQGGDNPRLVFVFDQFEEFFSYPVAMREKFVSEFADVLYNAVPQGQPWTDEQDTFMAGRLEVKAVFSIRSDRFSLLDQLSDRIPGILRKLYELRGLNREQAQEAIVRPALLEAKFASPRFEYTQAAVEHILQGLSGIEANSLTSHSPNYPNVGRGVEAFQLQILCQYIESEVLKGGIPDRDGNGLPDVDVTDLPDLGNIYEAYYRRQIEQMPAGEQVAARIVMEDGLLFVNEQTGEARRLSMDGGALIQRFRQFGVTTTTLQRLENALRRENSALGGVNFEISHDTLIVPVLKARAERMEEVERQLNFEHAEKERIEAENRALEAEERVRIETERRTEAERLQYEAQAQRTVAEKQRILAEDRRKISRRLAIMAVTLAFVAIGLGVWGWRSAALANERLIQVEDTSSQRDLLEFRQLVKNGNELFEGKYYESALRYYLSADTLQQKHANNTAFQLEAKNLSDKIRQCQTSLPNR